MDLEISPKWSVLRADHDNQSFDVGYKLKIWHVESQYIYLLISLVPAPAQARHYQSSKVNVEDSLQQNSIDIQQNITDVQQNITDFQQKSSDFHQNSTDFQQNI